jgi:hypothetical protein
VSPASERQFSGYPEDSARGTTQQRRFPCYHLDGPSVFEEESEHLSRHQSQKTNVCIDVQTAQRTSTPEAPVRTGV